MQISLLGCGWLGLPLAETFLNDGHTVKGSVTSPEKVAVLQSKGIQPYIIDLNAISGDVMDDFLKCAEVFIIAIPPKARQNNGLPYPEKLQGLLPFIKKAGIKKVLFTSSTSVYADAPDIPVVTENTLPNPDTESGKQVLAAEQVLQSCADFNTTVLRLGGLIGGDRHPVYHLAGRAALPNPDAPVNLADRDMIIEVVLKIVKRAIFGEVFVVVNPGHPARKAYYTSEAEKRGLPLPEFSDDGNCVGKLVDGTAALKLLNL
ncbi:NAD(P)H-binding protein [Flavobacterium sp. RHBU_24]|uniref:NAD(P)H-binding protein n=1 Tax=Flavobacterium sp. RHBU_24 TaxID=3391185 RepID=UPI003985159A